MFERLWSKLLPIAADLDKANTVSTLGGVLFIVTLVFTMIVPYVFPKTRRPSTNEVMVLYAVSALAVILNGYFLIPLTVAVVLAAIIGLGIIITR